MPNFSMMLLSLDSLKTKAMHINSFLILSCGNICARQLMTGKRLRAKTNEDLSLYHQCLLFSRPTPAREERVKVQDIGRNEKLHTSLIRRFTQLFRKYLTEFFTFLDVVKLTIL